MVLAARAAEAPSVHGGLELKTRCELALSGHICCDLWELTSTEREKQLGVSRGKLQMAHQTRRNLQSVALSTVALAASKPPSWDAFRHAHGISEIHIERHFGQLRAQSISGELTARSFWNAEATLARRIAKHKPVDDMPERVEEQPLNPAQLHVLQQASTV